ncbi:MAG: tRNA uridine-5-carboxymethylaminomethyl(34) synthesis GTPase MnmE [Acidobacteriota bacterium]
MPETIVALATPTGRSGIGVIRLSGNEALCITRKLVNDQLFAPFPREAILRQLHDTSTTDLIDEAIVTYFKAPHSFTGEDVIEISCHGSPVILRQVIDLCLQMNARMAEAGEFSLRALGNGRLNLAQAEAIRDLIEAQTRASARQAIRQLSGEFSNELQPIKDELLDVIVVLESALEFVEDDLPLLQSENVRKHLRDVKGKIGAIASTFQAGKLIREGLRIALVGRPNVGKSSLFNAFLGTDRAIVTELAGTTRDQIRERFVVDNIPIHLIDTAGLRETTDPVESIGVERSKRTMSDADLVVVVMDASDNVTRDDLEILESVSGIEHLVAINKVDKIGSEMEECASHFKTNLPASSRIALVSAKTGQGLRELQQLIVGPFKANDIFGSGFLVSDARHHDLLVRAEDEIRQSLDQLDQKMSEEIILIGLHNALRYLGEITGETTTEDMLTRIFATFCIGK